MLDYKVLYLIDDDNACCASLTKQPQCVYHTELGSLTINASLHDSLHLNKHSDSRSRPAMKKLAGSTRDTNSEPPVDLPAAGAEVEAEQADGECVWLSTRDPSPSATKAIPIGAGATTVLSRPPLVMSRRRHAKERESGAVGIQAMPAHILTR